MRRAHADAINRHLASDFPQLVMEVDRVDCTAFRSALADAGFLITGVPLGARLLEENTE